MISRPITTLLHVAGLGDGTTEISVEAHIADRVRGIAVRLTADEVRSLIVQLAATLPGELGLNPGHQELAASTAHDIAAIAKLSSGA